VGCRLFVAHEVVRNGILLVEFIIDGYHDATGNAEDGVNVFVFETFDNCLGPA
jgi:hypothetical protein